MHPSLFWPPFLVNRQERGHLPLTGNRVYWPFGVKTLASHSTSVQVGEIMTYTPELSMQSSMALRHIAWALGLLMTETLASNLDKIRICEAYRDRRCQEYLFGQDQTRRQ
jgi:hypothetical protein